MLFFFIFFFSFWLFLWSLFYFFFTRLYTSIIAKILFLNSHQRARKAPVTRIIPTNSTLPFAWSKISTKEFQCVYLLIWQSKAKGTTVFHFLWFEILSFDYAAAKDHWHVSSFFTVRFVGHKWAKTSNCLDSLSLRGERGNDLETGFFYDERAVQMVHDNKPTKTSYACHWEQDECRLCRETSPMVGNYSD